MTSQKTDHGQGNVPLDQLFDAVSHPARRRILFVLRERTPCAVEELDSGRARPERHAGTHSLVALHHVHLPHLAEAGFLIWNRPNDTIARGQRFPEVRSLLDWIDDRADEHDREVR